VLALRQEPAISAELAARFALDNAKSLNAAGHTSLGPTELYLAHFLGAGGAATFLNGLRDTPDRAAATALPQAANANTSIFYNGAAPRSYREIYDRFAQKFAGASTLALADSPAAATATGKINELKLSLPDRKIAEIAARVTADAKSDLTPRSTTNDPAPAPTNISKVELDHISEEALQTYLKGFGLIDQENNLMPNDGHMTRDASRGANLRGAEFGASGELSPLAQGARLVLRAVHPGDESQI
jgi:hypothetical protein